MSDGAQVVRSGGPADQRAVLGMIDSAVEWLAARGRSGQWGEDSWTGNPTREVRVSRLLADCESSVCEVGGTPAGALMLADRAPDWIPPVDEPECYVRMLVTDRRFAGCGIGARLLRLAQAQTARRGRRLLRLDCWAGADGALVSYYESQGFTRTVRFDMRDWPGQVLAMRVDPDRQSQ